MFERISKSFLYAVQENKSAIARKIVPEERGRQTIPDELKGRCATPPPTTTTRKLGYPVLSHTLFGV
jgi:hypothetical protein